MTADDDSSEGSGVAVVIPAHRAEPWLAETLDSILAQTLPADEIIVVDDGSPEPLWPIVEPYAGKILYARQPNAGPGAARNTGVGLTRAPLLAFCDADDLWEPEKLAVQVAYLREHPEASMVCSDHWSFGDRAPRARRHGAERPDLSLLGLIGGNGVSTLTVVLRREAFDMVGGFDEDRALIAVEDYDLWLRIAEHGTIAYLDEPLARYRVRGASLSGPETFLRGALRVLEKAAARLGARPDLRPHFRSHEAELLRSFAWHLCEHGRPRRALRPAFAALRRAPIHARSWRLLARALLESLPLVRGLRARSRGAAASHP